MAEKANDLVISYVVQCSGTTQSSYGPLQKALDEGYRVVDVFTTSVTPGGAANSHGHCVVTVLLTMHKPGLAYHRSSQTK